MIILYRDRSGRFSKFDRRKKLSKLIFDDEHNLLSQTKLKKFKIKAKKTKYVKAVVLEKQIKLPQEISKRERYFKYIELEREGNIDLFTFLAHKKINKQINQLQKKDKILVARVKIQIGDRIFRTGEFVIKTTDRQFQYGKRKGKIYTPKDIIANYIHKRINKDEDYTLYHRSTDTNALVKIAGTRKGKYYAKKQNIEVSFRYESKRRSKTISTVDKRKN